MRLTHWTDYTLRVLMYCAASQGREQPVTISEIAESHHISRSHLTKIVVDLANRGWLETTRGRGGGLRLSKPADQITLGEVVRASETDFNMVECFDAAQDLCRLSGQCRLQGVLRQALASYLDVLDRVTLAELVVPLGQGGTTMPLRRMSPGLSSAS